MWENAYNVLLVPLYPVVDEIGEKSHGVSRRNITSLVEGHLEEFFESLNLEDTASIGIWEVLPFPWRPGLEVISVNAFE